MSDPCRCFGGKVSLPLIGNRELLCKINTRALRSRGFYVVAWRVLHAWRGDGTVVARVTAGGEGCYLRRAAMTLGPDESLRYRGVRHPARLSTQVRRIGGDTPSVSLRGSKVRRAL